MNGLQNQQLQNVQSQGMPSVPVGTMGQMGPPIQHSQPQGPTIPQLPMPPMQHPQGQVAHPHTHLQVPSAQVLPLQGTQNLQPSPEQILQQNYLDQTNQNNYVPQQPVVSYTPVQPNAMTTQNVVQQQVGGMPLQQQINTVGQPQSQMQMQQMGVPQQQVMQDPNQAVPLTIESGNFHPDIPQEVLQDLVTNAQNEGITQQEVNQYVERELQDIAQKGSYENYQEYNHRMGLLQDTLEKRYGEQGADQAFDTIKQNIVAHGGEPLLQRFISDPSMLSPEVLMPYLNDGQGGGGGNPYEQYLNMGDSNAGRIGGGQPPQGGAVTAGGQVPNMQHLQAQAQQMHLDPQMVQLRSQNPAAWSAHMKAIADNMAVANRAQRQAF